MPPEALVRRASSQGAKPGWLLVPAVIEAVPLVDLNVGGFRSSVDQRVIHILGDLVDVAVMGELVAEERLTANHVERHLVFHESLPSLFNVGAVVARFVGHQHQ